MQRPYSKGGTLLDCLVIIRSYDDESGQEHDASPDSHSKDDGRF